MNGKDRLILILTLVGIVSVALVVAFRPYIAWGQESTDDLVAAAEAETSPIPTYTLEDGLLQLDAEYGEFEAGSPVELIQGIMLIRTDGTQAAEASRG